jgi:hypothetical protein
MRRPTSGAVRGGLAVAVFVLALPAAAQQEALGPIPAAECQDLAGRIHQAVGLATTVSEDDFSDLVGKREGRSCHIMATATGLAAADADALMAQIGTVFAGWRADPDRADPGRDAADKGFVKGDRIAVVEVSWEPPKDAHCSQQLPLSACKIAPQQRLWTAVIDVAEKTGK